MSELPEVVEIARDLIRIDTSNYGDGSGPGERAAAEYVATRFSEVGLTAEVYESEPGRASVVTRIEGADPSRGGLLIHGHLDVVPARADDWQVEPFAGEIKDGMLWGRGAVDMKDMCAMTVATVLDLQRSGRKPPRDLVISLMADEEAGGPKGARFLVDEHPGLFEGVTEGISEVGGFSVTVGDLRYYLIETAQKGIGWMRLRAAGRAGHGSMINEDNAVTALCEAVARLGRTTFPIVVTPTVQEFLEAMSEALGIELDPDDIEATISKLGPIARMVGATIRNTVNPTMLQAGYKANVIPGEAEAYVDGRFLPGQEEEFERQLDAILGPGIEREYLHYDPAVSTSFDGELVDAMAAALRAEDPGSKAVPYMLSGGTDAKSFARLGIRCFGFSPLQLPPDLDFTALFHGVDERVPLDALVFGQKVLGRFIAGS